MSGAPDPGKWTIWNQGIGGKGWVAEWSPDAPQGCGCQFIGGVVFFLVAIVAVPMWFFLQGLWGSAQDAAGVPKVELDSVYAVGLRDFDGRWQGSVRQGKERVTVHIKLDAPPKRQGQMGRVTMVGHPYCRYEVIAAPRADDEELRAGLEPLDERAREHCPRAPLPATALLIGQAEDGTETIRLLWKDPASKDISIPLKNTWKVPGH